jgi:cytochrome b involved in lipid metabolism
MVLVVLESMKKNKIILSSGLFILLIGICLYAYSLFAQYAPTSYVTQTKNGPITTNTTTGAVTSGAQTFALADVATHKDATSCYTVVNGAVYDLTMFVNGHKGGADAILSMCGHDATVTFMQAHGNQSKIMRRLARFQIGTSQNL